MGLLRSVDFSVLFLFLFLGYLDGDCEGMEV